MGQFSLFGEEGTLPAVAADLYLVPAGTAAVVRLITLMNDTGGDETVRLYKRAGGVNYEIVNQVLADGHRYEGPTSGAVQLDAGDSIQGDDAGSAAGIDYTLSGAEKEI